MNNKSVKKIRQMHQRELRRAAQKQSAVMRDIFKPKPKWVPWVVWRWFLRRFLKI